MSLTLNVNMTLFHRSLWEKIGHSWIYNDCQLLRDFIHISIIHDKFSNTYLLRCILCQTLFQELTIEGPKSKLVGITILVNLFLESVIRIVTIVT